MKGPLQSGVRPVPETDSTVASRSSYTKVLASGCSFQDVCGELIEVVHDRPVHSLPFISKTKLLSIAFHYPTDIDFRSNHGQYFDLMSQSLPGCWQ